MTPERPPIRLRPLAIDPDGREFAEICGWQFEGDAAFVSRILRDDIPQRSVFGGCRIWIYLDETGKIAGFGTLDICDYYSQFVGGRAHPYIPLLAANPEGARPGSGSVILEHLIAEAAILSRAGYCHEDLFLEVYTTSNRAIALYERFRFEYVTSKPLKDPDDGDREYHVMAKRTSVSAD